MNETGVDPQLLHAWLSARSIARGLPAPAPDHGGYRVDTNSTAEIKRWVFPRVCAGLLELAHSIREPRYLLKLCGDADALRPALPDGWQIHAPSYLMRLDGKQIERPVATGYVIEVDRRNAVVEVRIRSATGEVAAHGYSAETRDAFVYDRIATGPEHRRKGLGSAVMTALHRARRCPNTPELLVATEEGRALYASLGWRTISPYSTASIIDA